MPFRIDSQNAVSITSNTECQPDYSGPLDFAFIVHARTIEDLFEAYPHLRDCDEESALAAVRPKPVLVGSPIQVTVGEQLCRGELIGIPYRAVEFRRKLPEIRQALRLVLDYCSKRQTKIVGLGGLLPSVTRHGRDLIPFADGVGITTGHSYTAHVIAEQVQLIEQKLGVSNIAILGAAGSMGQATFRLLSGNGRDRKILLLDVPSQMSVLHEMASRHKNGASETRVEISSELSALKNASVIVCVTNSPSAMIRSEHLSPGCIVIDDAQPPNITIEVARAAKATVLKCLACVPKLQCPFDFGLFRRDLLHEKQNTVFTCLAETVMLAANGSRGHFTIGHPTDEQLQTVAHLSRSLGITIAPFQSFPEIGEVTLDGRVFK